MKKIKLLVVDDSILFREVLTRYIREDSQIDVVGTAGDPYSARDMILKYEPDVMTLDIEMPRMDGVAFLKKLLPQYYLPVITVSSSNNMKQAALDAGCIEFIQKPLARTTAEMQSFAQTICRAVKSAYDLHGDHSKAEEPEVVHTSFSTTAKRFRKNDVVLALGASTGGTEALEQVIKNLPADSPATVVVQHMPAGFTKLYSERLNKNCPMEVKEAEDGDRLRRGLVIIGAGEHHLRLCRDSRGYYVSSKPGEKVSGHCPSVDVLFSSVADTAKANAIGVILTGMGRDGADGLLKMRQSGAFTIGQDKATCVVYGMPMEAYNIGAVQVQAPLYKIADHNGGISMVWGHYFTSNDSQNNLVSAYRDLFSRALSDVNQHTRFEEFTPKIGSIIRTVNGEDMQFELTDEECNGIWDMVEQQNVESHFADLLSENGFDVNSADVKKVITEMASQYREDFGFGDDEEFQGYISERDDDLKEHLNSEIFGDVYVDNVASDYTGRIMIIRPEYFSSRSFTPDEQLFLAQSGPGCDPKEYGGAVNGVFLYDREEASVTSDCFLGAMREEHIPMWAREARDDISEGYDEQPEM